MSNVSLVVMKFKMFGGGVQRFAGWHESGSVQRFAGWNESGSVQRFAGCDSRRKIQEMLLLVDSFKHWF